MVALFAVGENPLSAPVVDTGFALIVRTLVIVRGARGNSRCTAFCTLAQSGGAILCIYPTLANAGSAVVTAGTIASLTSLGALLPWGLLASRSDRAKRKKDQNKREEQPAPMKPQSRGYLLNYRRLRRNGWR